MWTLLFNIHLDFVQIKQYLTLIIIFEMMYIFIFFFFLKL
jgi:hypothetical protein